MSMLLSDGHVRRWVTAVAAIELALSASLSGAREERR